jgi:hypothetical protein
MLYDRVRPADTKGTMYHYCSAQTFVNIIQHKTIRFSDINLLNDAEEARWGYSTFIEVANRILKRDGLPESFPQIPEEFFDRIDAIWSPFGLHLSNFVACFSVDGDSLSQWRAYADDGRGFAIGFKAQELRRLPIQILDVLYDREQQLREMEIAIGAMFLEFGDKGRDYKQPWFFERSATLAASSVALKNPAWRDEKEVRCQHVVDVKIGPENWQLTDAGGLSGETEVNGQPVQFQVRNGTISPFLDMPFDVSTDHQPIEEIVLGPKCPNAYSNIWFLLGNHGYGKVPLRTAGNAYR